MVNLCFISWLVLSTYFVVAYAVVGLLISHLFHIHEMII